MQEEAVRELVRIESWLRSEAEKLSVTAKSRRDAQEMWRNADLNSLDEGRAIAQVMFGRKIPRTSMAKARANGEMEGSIAAKYEARGCQVDRICRYAGRPTQSRGHTMSKPGHFDVCKVMSERNLDIRLAPLDNITNMKTAHKGMDTDITIGFPGNIISSVLNGKFVGGLLLCDAEQYKQIKAELEANHE
jgi:hypothetical protein